MFINFKHKQKKLRDNNQDGIYNSRFEKFPGYLGNSESNSSANWFDGFFKMLIDCAQISKENFLKVFLFKSGKKVSSLFINYWK